MTEVSETAPFGTKVSNSRIHLKTKQEDLNRLNTAGSVFDIQDDDN